MGFNKKEILNSILCGIVLLNSTWLDNIERIWNMVVVTFQSVFHSKIYQNNIFFYFKKIIFYISVSK